MDDLGYERPVLAASETCLTDLYGILRHPQLSQEYSV